MKMNASKTDIFTNRNANHPEFPQVGDLKLGPDIIQSIKKPSELTRVLGYWMTMDNRTSKAKEFAVKRLKQTKNLL